MMMTMLHSSDMGIFEMRKLLLIFIILVGISLPTHAVENSITHVVIVWLNDDVSDKTVTDIIDKTQVLSTIAVVQDLKIGRPVLSERAIVDDSFSFAISVSFKSNADMKIYAGDKTHLDYVKSVLKPSLKKLLIYDF